MEAGLDNLIAKSKKLTGYLEFIINDIGSRVEGVDFEIISSTDSDKRGCQLSVLCHGQGRKLFDNLMERGVITDWREPNVIRMAPVPLYNNFEDIYRFGQKLEDSLV
jgi:kynureninase